MGKPSLVFNGYQYLIYGKNSKLMVGCLLKANAVSANRSWKLIYSTKSSVKRTIVSSQT